MNTLQNSLTPMEISVTLADLADRCKNWEEGLNRQSNDVLYDILADCLDLYTQVKADRKLNRMVTESLEDAGLGSQSNTSLQLRICRRAFMDTGKRAVAYARVIAIAFEKKPEKQPLPSWIRENGGIENIRRDTTGTSGASKREKKIDNQIEYLAQVEPLGAIEMTSDAEVLFDDNLTSALAAAVVRGRSDGKVELVYSTDNRAALNEVLSRVPNDEAEAAKSELEAARRAEEEEEHQKMLAAAKAAVVRGEDQ